MSGRLVMFLRITGLVPLVFAASLVVAGCNGAPAAGTSADVAQPSTGDAAPSVEQSATSKPANSIVRVVELNSWYRAVLVERAATRNPHDLEALVRPVCDGLTVCRVGVWTDEWSMPNAMPVRGPQLEAQEYAFGRNAKGEETSLWNCNKYPEFEAEDVCLPRLLN
jgi:predicted small secreted protein